MARLNITNENISKIVNLYNKWGASDYIGESITQIEHGLQCAKLATEDSRLLNYDNFTRQCVIIAALLHDIGHLIGLERQEMEMQSNELNGLSLGIVGHEGIGSSFLQECGVNSLVCKLVAGHVPAKRFLCTTRKDYYNRLSDASKQTMQLQGGMMNDIELLEFQKDNIAELKIYLREYDDEAKKINLNLSSKSQIMDYLSFN